METLDKKWRQSPPRLKRDDLFICKLCNFTSSQKSHLTRHFKTEKHKRAAKGIKGIIWTKQGTTKSVIFDKIFECLFCPKTFKSKGGKYKHMKKCSNNPHIKDKVKFLEKQLELEKERNQELEQKIKKQDKTHEHEKVKLENKYLKKHVKVLKNNKGNTQNINTQNNNYFNIQVYLDEKCKNAMPIMDFIKDLQFKLTDINPERPASTIESLSKAITDKLEDMEENERPLHCSDQKRLVFHVKDASGWAKDIDNKKIDKAIGWANMRHQGAWYERVKEEGLDQTKKDMEYHTMNVAMAKFSDDPKKAKRKIKRAIARTIKMADIKN